MSAYIRDLKAQSERANAEYADRQRARVTPVRETKLVPLEVRLARLLAGIPAELKNEGLQICALKASLRGRGGGTAHAGELGMALRKLGYVRKRQWRGPHSFGALWYPHGNQHNSS